MQSVPWGPAAAIVFTVAGFIAVDVLVSFLIFSIVKTGGGDSIVASQAALEQNLTLLFTYYGSTRLIAIGLIYWFVAHRGGGLRELGFRSFSVARAAGVLIVSLVGFIVATFLATVLLEYIAPGVNLNAEQSIPFLNARGMKEAILAFLALVVIAPIAEETIFRGLLLPGIGKLIGMWPAAVLISIGFGLLHPPVATMVVIGIFSFFLCAVYMKTGSIWPAIMLHAAKNLIAFIAVI